MMISGYPFPTHKNEIALIALMMKFAVWDMWVFFYFLSKMGAAIIPSNLQVLHSSLSFNMGLDLGNMFNLRRILYISAQRGGIRGNHARVTVTVKRCNFDFFL